MSVRQKCRGWNKQKMEGKNMTREFRTYEQDLQELNIAEEQYSNIISEIYDKTDDEMMAIAKTIKAGGKVLETARRAFERVLDMRYTERLEVYKYYYSR